MLFHFLLSTVDVLSCFFFFFTSRRRHTRLQGDWSSDVCSSDLNARTPRHKYSATRNQNHTGLPARCTLPIRPRTLPVRTPLTLRPIRSRPTTTTNTLFGTFRRLTVKLSRRALRPD